MLYSDPRLYRPDCMRLTPPQQTKCGTMNQSEKMKEFVVYEPAVVRSFIYGTNPWEPDWIVVGMFMGSLGIPSLTCFATDGRR